MDAKRYEHLISLLVILFLGLWGTIGLLGVLRLVEQKADPAQITVVVALVGPLLGAMAGVLIKTPGQPGPVQATITNTDKNPVPTTTEDKEDKPDGD